MATTDETMPVTPARARQQDGQSSATFAEGGTADHPAAVHGRQWKRRARTRARLLRAARVLVAERGLDNVTMSDISAAADLAAGTVYNYFTTLDELRQTLVHAEIEAVGERLDRVAEHITDPAEVYSASLRILLAHAVGDPLWARIYVGLGVAHPVVVEILGPRCRRDLEKAVAAGRLQLADMDLAVVCTFGSLASAITLLPEMRGPEELAINFARSMLRMVGMTASEAESVATRPLPAVG